MYSCNIQQGVPTFVPGYSSLLPPEMVKQKYPKLRGPNRAGELAVKLAVEAFFGPDVLALWLAAVTSQDYQ